MIAVFRRGGGRRRSRLGRHRRRSAVVCYQIDHLPRRQCNDDVEYDEYDDEYDEDEYDEDDGEGRDRGG